MNAYFKISATALQGCDPAELGQLTATVGRILPAIEEFWRYDGRDDAARRRPGWLTRLDVPLPEDGGGMEAVVADLAEAVIPNGARVSEPGWSGFITTGPTTSAVAAWLAAAAAGSQRYTVQAFNTLERVALDWVAPIPSSTVVGGHLVIRPCFINPHTRLADVDALVDHVVAIGDELTALQPG
jgi:hypothetical protein